MPAMALGDLARVLLALAAAARDDPRSHPTACGQAGRRLAKGLAGAGVADRMVLARVARVPVDRLDEWLADTLDLLDRADGTERRRLAAAARLETIGWAWAPEVPTLSDQTVEALREGWASAHQLP